MHPGLLEGSANTKFGEVERRLGGCMHETLRNKLGVYLVHVWMDIALVIIKVGM